MASHLTENHLLGFRDELQKVASTWQQAALGAGGGAGAGLVLGGLAGGLYKGVQGYREARDYGASRGSAFTSGLSHGLGGVTQGAQVGAGLGAVAGGAAGYLRPNAVNRMANLPGILGSGARTGMRQVHGLTGALPEGDKTKAYDLLRMHGYDARQAVSGAEATLKSVTEGNAPKVRDLRKAYLTKRPVTEAEAKSGLEAAQKRMKYTEKLEGKGLTSIPGYYNRAVTQGRGILPTMYEDLHHSFHAGDSASKALMVGAPAIGLYSAIKNPETPEGPGKGESITREALSTASGLVGGGLPMGTNMLIGKGVHAVGTGIGRTIDYARGRRRPVTPPITEPPELNTANPPAERITSPRASGHLESVIQ